MVQIVKSLEQQTAITWFSQPDIGHIAHFYADEHKVAHSIHDYIYFSLLRHEACIVIATPQKLITLQKGLRQRGIDIGAALSNGWYVAYDAEELLLAFMDDHELNTKRFSRSIAKLVAHVRDAEQPVRMFSELAAVLRQQNNKSALLQVEHAFDELFSKHNFSLYCAYEDSTEYDAYGEMYRKILAVHDHAFYS